MEPANLRFGGGATETILHPLVAVWLLVAIVLIFTLPRNKVIVPLLFTFFSVSIAQVVLIGGIHFTVLRILIIAGLIRRATAKGTSSEAKYPGGFNGIDKAVVLWATSALIVICLQWMNSQAMIKNLGDFLDGLGGYLVVRFFIPDLETVRRAIKVFALICFVQAAFMVYEQIAHQNLFGYLGGWPPVNVTYRDTHIRSQGVLGNINEGVFGGVLVPLFLWLGTGGKSRFVAFLGLAGAITMVITCDASTAILALGGSILGICFWPLRKRMRIVRWGFALMLIGLHMVMKAPVWALIARIDLTGASSGQHRSYLIDNCVRHFSDWWLLGSRYYNEWGYFMFDLCNQFVAVAVTGGLASLVFFIMMYSRSFGAIGDARKQVNGDKKKEWLIWCVGTTLFAHVVASFGINYMALLQMALFPILVFASVVALDAQKATVKEVEPSEKLHLVPQGYIPIGEAR
jgi:hypothetical protein